MTRRHQLWIRQAAAILMIAAGVSHSFYYVSGLIGGWEKDLWNLAQIAAGICAALLGGLVWLWRHKEFDRRASVSIRIVQVTIGLGLLLFIGTEMAIWYAGRSTEPVQSDYVLILGARVRGETVSLSLKARLDRGLDYMKQYPETKVILSGGQGPGESITEAAAMKRYLLDHGVPERLILGEDQSTNTYENLLFSHTLLTSQGVDASKVKVTLITNDFHMLRSKLLAHRVGLSVYGFSSQTPPYTLPRMLTREFAALLKSFAIDR
ncbi:YdcF family protein [Gorillibacterium sp. sgz5001074]|uniref:YdcF family protein n=1 Tax=Gorillibacterium sp. sgz5001074 TaxID=3446695 RepID=UPI003F670EFD